MVEYTLEIYEPGDENSVWVSVKSESPFLAISAGDFISTSTGKGATGGQEYHLPILSRSAGSDLRVTRVMHVVWGSDAKNMRHKMMVFTEEADSRKEQ